MVSAESDIDRRDRAATTQRRLQQVAWFPLAEGDRPSCSYRCSRNGAGVGGDSRGKVNGDGRDALRLHSLHKAGNGAGQSGTSPDAENAVDDQVIRHRAGHMKIIDVDQSATRVEQRGQSSRVWCA